MSKSIEKFLLVVTDFVMINLAFIVYFALRVQSGLFDLVIMPEFFLPMIALYFYWLLIFTFVGMYRSWFAASRFDEISTLFKATFVGIFILFFIIFLDDYINKVSSSTRILIFIYWALLVAFVGSGRVVIRSIQRNLLIKGIGRRNSIIIGFNDRAFEVLNTLLKAPALGIDVKAFATIKDEHLNKVHNNIKVEANLKSLTSLIEKYNVQEIILALEQDEHDSLVI